MHMLSLERDYLGVIRDNSLGASDITADSHGAVIGVAGEEVDDRGKDAPT